MGGVLQSLAANARQNATINNVTYENSRSHPWIPFRPGGSCFGPDTSGAVAVMNNSTEDSGYNLKASTYEVADEIILDGTDWSLAYFGFEYYNTSANAVQAQVRFDLNDGPQFRPKAGWKFPQHGSDDSGRSMSIPPIDQPCG